MFVTYIFVFFERIEFIVSHFFFALSYLCGIFPVWLIDIPEKNIWGKAVICGTGNDIFKSLWPVWFLNVHSSLFLYWRGVYPVCFLNSRVNVCCES